jgi:hypothetical protein
MRLVSCGLRIVVTAEGVSFRRRMRSRGRLTQSCINRYDGLASLYVYLHEGRRGHLSGDVEIHGDSRVRTGKATVQCRD